MDKIEKLIAFMATLSNEIAKLSEADNVDTEALNAKTKEYEECEVKLEALKKAEEIANKALENNKKVNIVVGKDLETEKPWNSAADFYKAVKNVHVGEVDKRLAMAATEYNGGEDGGFLIPPEFSSEIQKSLFESDDSLLSMCRRVPVTGNAISLPTSETKAWDSGSGHVQSYWQGEQQQMQESKTKFGQFDLRLRKLTTLIRVTDELLEDARALEAWSRVEAMDAMKYKNNKAIIQGSGVGQPKGFLNSDYLVTVAKESGQTANSIWWQNINKMYYAMQSALRKDAVWLVQPDMEELFPEMSFDEGAASKYPVYLGANGVSAADYDTLKGKRVMPMMGGMKALGAKGDIAFCNFSQYLVIYKEIQEAMSIHVYFDTNETAFRFVQRIDGGIAYKNAITPENGTKPKSGFVTLAARA